LDAQNEVGVMQLSILNRQIEALRQGRPVPADLKELSDAQVKGEIEKRAFRIVREQLCKDA